MKLTRSTLALALSALVLGATAHAQTTGARTTPDASQQVERAVTTDERRSALVREDEDFLNNAIHGSYAEIEGSKLALEKTKSAEVKAFATQMIADHEAVLNEVTALARQKNVEPPTGPSVMQTTEITALRALSGGAFDAMYINRLGVAAHESSIERFEKAVAEAQDPEVKAWAEKSLPKLRDHLEMAHAIDRKQDRQ